jgi:hypothetical protein
VTACIAIRADDLILHARESGEDGHAELAESDCNRAYNERGEAD